MASSPSLTQALEAQNYEALLREMRTHRITLEGGFAVVFRDRCALGQYQLPQDGGRAIIDPASTRRKAMSPRDRSR